MTSYGTQSHYSDQRFAAIDGSVGDFPPLYSDLPFSRRKKYGRNSDNDAIKWAMRCVLASPVLVLCLWTVGAFVFANKHVSTNNSASAQMMKQRQAQMVPQSPQMMMLPQQLPLQQQQPLQQQPVMMMSQQAGQPLQMQQAGQPLQMQQEQPQMQQQQQQPVMMMSQQEAHPMQQTQEQPVMQQVQEAAQPMQLQQEQPAMQLQQEQPLMQQTMQEQPVMQRGRKNKNQRPGAMHQRPLPHYPSPPQQQQQQQQQIQQQQPLQVQQQQQQPPQVLYYEPSQAMANGKLEAPMTVYDLNGNPIPLQALRGAQIFMEPPTPQQVMAPQRGISTQDIQKWGESTSQDQSIIVATVAVMALLVGAISARRMRSRNVLSSCIENEALEDDVAYDTAYTTNKDNSYYNTFASGGWKGDLEKFDV
ncbi:unnamed protein product [Cylindrotheca closterium]|uniref:Uncharacterized protein n=1 Tax=Cylindrotheca closterium TaxID=2856 RepID=A0AAD2FKN0_9STRA|nr:unnamed protein product [Cylindrotheca closterium]